MNLVEVKRISYYPPSKGYAVLLEEKESGRNLPIIVGSNEAQAIALYLEGVDMPRPMTHDLLINLLHSLKSELHSVSIAKMQNGTFFAEIKVFNSQIGDIVIDSRPSDAIAIALRTMTPLYVSDEIMERAGIDIYEEELGSSKEHLEAQSINRVKKDTDELSLQKLNKALEKAILEEEYENAAEIRDKIKSLEK